MTPHTDRAPGAARGVDPLDGLITSSVLASFVVAALAIVLAELAR